MTASAIEGDTTWIGCWWQKWQWTVEGQRLRQGQ